MHGEGHRIGRIGLLRASVLGANDGIISTSSLIIGVASSGVDKGQILMTAVAGLVAGAMSMAAGEYVSVSSQADTEKADYEKEKFELENYPQAELDELTQIYCKRGLEPALAKEVASQMTKHNALEAHLRDELGLIELHQAQPFQAAISSAATFSIGAGLPTLIVFLVDKKILIQMEAVVTLLALFAMGGIASRVGGAPFFKGALRVSFWGSLAMIFTFLIGHLFNVSV